MNRQVWNADKYQEHADFVSKLASPVVELLQPQHHEKILDLGCGDGVLTETIASMCDTVIGIDSSSAMINAAKAKGLNGIVMSAEEMILDERFDAVFSNAALHWMLRPWKVLAGVNGVLATGGRFVGEFGGAGNIAALTASISNVFKDNPELGSFSNPWYFPSDGEYAEMLRLSGFEVEYIALIPRPTPIDDIGNWLDIFADGITTHLDEAQKQFFKEEVRKILKPTLYSDKNGWVADYVRLRFKAIKVD